MLVLNAYHQSFPKTSSAASERAVSEHFSATLYHTSKAYKRMGLTTEVYRQATTFGDNPYVFPTAKRHCQYAMLHYQIFHLIRHPQFSTKKSRIIKTPIFLLFVNFLSALTDRPISTYESYTSSRRSLGHPACGHIAYLRTCLFGLRLIMCMWTVYFVGSILQSIQSTNMFRNRGDSTPPCGHPRFTSTLTLLPLISTRTVR
jgi:hypothetical protein